VYDLIINIYIYIYRASKLCRNIIDCFIDCFIALNTLYRQYLLEAGYHCHLQESDCHTNITSFSQFLVDNNIVGVFGIHALHAGKLLRGLLFITSLLILIVCAACLYTHHLFKLK